MPPDPEAEPEPDSEPAAAAVLLAAGRSTRMGGTERKPFLELAGRTVLEHAAAAFDRCASVRAIVVVAQEEDLGRVRELARRSPALRKVVAVVAGGAERTDSVTRGVDAAPADCELVAIHDAARVLVRTETIERCLRAAHEGGAALVAVPSSDTVKESEDGRRSARTLDRSRLWLAQTPQAFRAAP
jgi:2-C-methyl-D-erythritol 4-phosphate cytidylyltransferase